MFSNLMCQLSRPWLVAIDPLGGVNTTSPVTTVRSATPTAPIVQPQPPTPAEVIEKARTATRDALVIAERQGLSPEIRAAVGSAQAAMRELEAAMTPEALAKPGGQELATQLAKQLKERISDIAICVARSCDPAQGKSLQQRLQELPAGGTVDRATAQSFADRAFTHPEDLRGILLGPNNRIDAQKLQALDRMMAAMDDAGRARMQGGLEKAGLSMEVANARRHGSILQTPEGKSLAQTSLDVDFRRTDPVAQGGNQQMSRLQGTVSGTVRFDANFLQGSINQALRDYGVTGDSIKSNVSYRNDPAPPRLRLELWAEHGAVSAATWATAAVTGYASGSVDLGGISISTNASGQIVLTGDGALGRVLAGVELGADAVGLKEKLLQTVRDMGFEIQAWGNEIILTPRFSQTGSTPFQVPPIPLGQGDASVNLQDVAVTRGQMTFNSNDGSLVYTFEAQANATLLEGTGPDARQLPVPESLSLHSEARIPNPGNTRHDTVEVEVRDANIHLNINQDEAAAARNFLRQYGHDVSASGDFNLNLSGHVETHHRTGETQASFDADITARDAVVNARAQREKTVKDLVRLIPDGEHAAADRQALTAALAANDALALVRALRQVRDHNPVLAEAVQTILAQKDTHAEVGTGQISVQGQLDLDQQGNVDLDGQATVTVTDLTVVQVALNNDITAYHLDEGSVTLAGNVSMTKTEQITATEGRIKELQDRIAYWDGTIARVGELGDQISAEAAKTFPDLGHIQALLDEQEQLGNLVNNHVIPHTARLREQLAAEQANLAKLQADIQASGTVVASGTGIDTHTETQGEDGTRTVEDVSVEEAEVVAAGTVDVSSRDGTKAKRTVDVAGTATGEVDDIDRTKTTTDKDGNTTTSSTHLDRTQFFTEGVINHGPEGTRVEGNILLSAEGVRQTQTEVRTEREDVKLEDLDPRTQEAIAELNGDFKTTWDAVQEQLGPDVQRLANNPALSAEERQALQNAIGNSGDALGLVRALSAVQRKHPELANAVNSILDKEVDRGFLRWDHSLRELQTKLEHTARPEEAAAVSEDLAGSWDQVKEQLGPGVEGLIEQVGQAGGPRAEETIRSLRAAMDGGDPGQLINALIETKARFPALEGQVESVLKTDIERTFLGIGFLAENHSLRELQELLDRGLVTERVERKTTDVQVGEATMTAAHMSLFRRPDGSVNFSLPGANLTLDQVNVLMERMASDKIPPELSDEERQQMIAALRQVSATQGGVQGTSVTLSNLSLSISKDGEMSCEADLATQVQGARGRLPLPGPPPSERDVVVGDATLRSHFKLDKLDPPSYSITGAQASFQYSKEFQQYLFDYTKAATAQYGELRQLEFLPDGSFALEFHNESYVDATIKARVTGSDRVLNIGADIQLENPLLAPLSGAVNSLVSSYAPSYIGGASEAEDGSINVDVEGARAKYLPGGLSITDFDMTPGTISVSLDFHKPQEPQPTS